MALRIQRLETRAAPRIEPIEIIVRGIDAVTRQVTSCVRIAVPGVQLQGEEEPDASQ